MLVFGDFRNGNIWFLDLGVAFPFQVGDVVFMRSRVLKHFLLPYVGKERFVLVFSTSQSIFDWLEIHGVQKVQSEIDQGKNCIAFGGFECLKTSPPMDIYAMYISIMWVRNIIYFREEEDGDQKREQKGDRKLEQI
jgi:hypothetical protein